MIPISDITNLSNVHLPENSIVWVYEIHTELAKNYSTTSQQWIFQKHSASPLCPIPQSYIDCILSGCMQFGTDFAKEFITTTKGWSAECWINDRKYCAGTRKYIIRKDLGEKSLCDLSVKNVDNLLANTLPTEFTHKLEI
ncbi:hypothetical protein BC833DRAFT_580524 [Globomyces pollinis-pini]|nr:hypothetical protein BC833DRAFT_580524 [Globomyces pollinis-pini]